MARGRLQRPSLDQKSRRVLCDARATGHIRLTEEMTMKTPGIRVRTFEWIPLDDVEHADVVRR